MQKLILYLALLCIAVGHAQQPEKPTSSEIYQKLQKLNVLGTALYIAAHPDDENTRLISFLANDAKVRTGYLSLTRGDGGQNLIGQELRELLGVIRTQELIEARKVDGGEQYFSRANDFGYSKLPDETLMIWDKEKVLQDMVWVIRSLQPDVIVTRFDHRSPGTTHGHHTTSAMLTQEAFELAADPNYQPEQLKYVATWQPKRVFFNVSWWFFGGKDKFDKADKSKYINLQTGSYYPLLGKSNQEIAALSRSRHKSQGFGTTGARGEDMEYLELIKGPELKNKQNLFEGIDTSWNRIEGGRAIGDALALVIKNYNFRNPAASVPGLLQMYKNIKALPDGHWKKIKLAELKEIIAMCTGLYLEAVAENQSATPGSVQKVKWEAVNRSEVPLQLKSITVLPEGKTFSIETPLANNVGQEATLDVNIPAGAEFTSPYWLNEKGTSGMYKVDDLKKIGKADIIRQMKAVFTLEIGGQLLDIERNIVYKTNDPVQGEVYRPFDVVPDVTTKLANKVQLYRDNRPQDVVVSVTAGRDGCKGTLSLDLPAGWKVAPVAIPFAIAKKGGVETVTFQVTPPSAPTEATARCIASLDGKEFDRELLKVDYPHISTQQVLLPSQAKFVRADLNIKGEKVAYIMGAGDNIPESLRQMGYDVTLLTPPLISAEKLQEFDAVVVGIRAYNVLDGLAAKQQLLFDYVSNGGTMIVQYNTTGELVTKDIAPYPLRISRDRVTDEDAKIEFPDATNRLLNYPNKITAKDFTGWVQEQGLYYPDEWAPAFTPLLASADKGEPIKKGALLAARYGKGYYIYTGLSFFRELPEGVTGAYRLMANLIAAGK